MFKDNKITQLLTKSVQNNILPLTSRCNASCIFCSHRSNPDGLNIFYPNDIPIQELIPLIDFLDKDSPIIIGESATRLSEGEPFLYKDFNKIISLLRKKFDNTEIIITTNGMLLNDQKIDFLSKIGKIRLRISLNSLEHHREIVGGDPKTPFLKIIKQLRQRNIPYTISLMYIKEYQDDLISEMDILINEDVKEIRLLKPGYSRYLKKSFEWPDKSFYKKIKKLRKKALIFIEPPELNSLDAEIIGIIKDSPADKAGLKTDDIIINIDGYTPISRVDCFKRLLKIDSCSKLMIIRGCKKLHIDFKKNEHQRPGIAFDYDISKNDYSKIRSILENNGILATGKLAGDFFKKIFSNYSENIISCVNSTFGGNIEVAGLLTLRDIQNQIPKYSSCFIPDIMLDDNGYDLAGENISDYPDFKI